MRKVNLEIVLLKGNIQRNEAMAIKIEFCTKFMLFDFEQIDINYEDRKKNTTVLGELQITKEGFSALCVLHY